MGTKLTIPGLFLLFMPVLAQAAELINNRILNNKAMTSTTFPFPAHVIECEKGDYIIQQNNDSQWQVYLVEDIVWLTRLLVLNIDGKPELIEEKHALDSQPPEIDGIHLLLTSFSNKFNSSKAAMIAIKRCSWEKRVKDDI